MVAEDVSEAAVPRASFMPGRYASIDIGTVTCRILVADVTASGELHELDELTPMYFSSKFIPDYAMSDARYAFDWNRQFELSLDPERARERRFSISCASSMRSANSLLFSPRNRSKFLTGFKFLIHISHFLIDYC